VVSSLRGRHAATAKMPRFIRRASLLASALPFGSHSSVWLVQYHVLHVEVGILKNTQPGYPPQSMRSLLESRLELTFSSSGPSPYV
jgi:hypothetical protein